MGEGQKCDGGDVITSKYFDENELTYINYNTNTGDPPVPGKPIGPGSPGNP